MFKCESLRTKVTCYKPLPKLINHYFLFKSRLLLGGLPLRLEDSAHLLALSLSSDVSSEALLRELETSLILGYFEQLETALLVRSESGDFSHHFPDELDVLVLDALSARWFHGRLRGEENTQKPRQ